MTRKKKLTALVGTALMAYLFGFWAVMFLIRSESEGVRVLGIQLNWLFYQQFISATRDTSYVRAVNVRRFEWMCEGYEHRCSVDSSKP
jgi:hypothetical protein